MTTICFVYRKLEENYNYIRVLSEIIFLPYLNTLHSRFFCFKCPVQKGFFQSSAIKNNLVDTFVEKASERLKNNFFQHPRLSKSELNQVRDEISSEMHSF